MKLFLATALLVLGSWAYADDPIYVVGGDPAHGKPGMIVTKVEALKKLILEPDAAVLQCKAVELTKKAGFRAK